MVIMRQAAVFIKQETNVVRAEDTAVARALREQRIVSKLLEFAAKPMVNRQY